MENYAATKLLVSVRDAREANVAVEAGADLIDVKEPDRGSLGAADRTVMASVVEAVAARVPVSVALGELLERDADEPVDLPAGVCFAKGGLAGCANEPAWQSRWWRLISKLPEGVRPVAVIYADGAAEAPTAEEVLAVVADGDFAAVLIDTFDKSGGDLFSHWSVSRLAQVLADSRRVSPLTVVAGSLAADSIGNAVACRPDYVAVRGAACRGGRTSTVDASRVQRLVRLLTQPEVSAESR